MAKYTALMIVIDQQLGQLMSRPAAREMMTWEKLTKCGAGKICIPFCSQTGMLSAASPGRTPTAWGAA